MAGAGLFDKLYGASKEALEEAKRPIVRNQLKRKLKAAFDSAEGQKIDAEANLQKLRQDFANFDINKINESKGTIEAAESTKTSIRAEYKIMFDEDLPSGE